MNDPNSDVKGKCGCAAEDGAATCCQPSDGTLSSCCNPRDGSWTKGKVLISVIIITAAIGVGANSILRGTSAQAYKVGPAKSFSASLAESPATAIEIDNKANALPNREEISVNRALDSLQALDTLAADRDVVFIVLPGEEQNPAPAVLKQVGVVANNLWTSGQKIDAFTLKTNAPDYGYLVGHFAIKSFPCVIVLGRRGTASAVSGDISEARLYNAVVLASKPASCCPTQNDAACCPTQSNAACCPK
jgi:hypothetical protein